MMSFSHETKQKINQFAREQAQRYLQEAEMTYLEKLRRKTGQAKQKLEKRLARFKGSSEQGREAQNDLIVYMSDYMSDLMSQGLSEQEAFEKAKEELTSQGNSNIHLELHERFEQYYENLNPADYEAIGLFYGGFMFFGIAAGTMIGFITSGGVPTFSEEGWIYTLVGTGAGIVTGLGFGLISHALIVTRNRR